jgi:hypothetical protein
LLRQGRAFATGQPTAKDALALSEGIIRRGRTMADQAAPDIADFLASIGPAQIERMSARFAEKNADFAKEAKLGENEAAQRTVRYKRLLERAEYWFGDFNDTQQAALRQLVEGQNPGTRFWYDERFATPARMAGPGAQGPVGTATAGAHHPASARLRRGLRSSGRSGTTAAGARPAPRLG